jgi:hypothetical protein
MQEGKGHFLFLARKRCTPTSSCVAAGTQTRERRCFRGAVLCACIQFTALYGKPTYDALLLSAG